MCQAGALSYATGLGRVHSSLHPSSASISRTGIGFRVHEESLRHLALTRARCYSKQGLLLATRRLAVPMSWLCVTASAVPTASDSYTTETISAHRSEPWHARLCMGPCGHGRLLMTSVITYYARRLSRTHIPVIHPRQRLMAFSCFSQRP